MNLEVSHITVRNKVMRALWNAVCALLYRQSPILFYGWRRMLLRLFGADVAPGAKPYPKTRIWAPWNLTMMAGSCLANYVDCYSVGRVTLEENAIVSQYAYLCAATHDYEDPDFTLMVGPITVGSEAWIAADAFIAPGVQVGRGAVVGARSVVTKDVAPWTVVAGCPAIAIKKRVMRTQNHEDRETA